MWLPAARMYSEPFPGWSSKLFTSVPTGRAPSGYASPSLAETVKSMLVLYHSAKSRRFPVTEQVVYLPCVRWRLMFWWRLQPACSPWQWSIFSGCPRQPAQCQQTWRHKCFWFFCLFFFKWVVEQEETSKRKLILDLIRLDRTSQNGKLQPILPARVVPHFHNLLFKRLAVFSIFVAQPLKVYHSISLLVAAANSMRTNSSCIVHSKMVSSHFGSCQRQNKCGFGREFLK